MRDCDNCEQEYCELACPLDEIDALETENAALKDNYQQAMILYNKSEEERKELQELKDSWEKVACRNIRTNNLLRQTLNRKDELLEFLR